MNAAIRVLAWSIALLLVTLPVVAILNGWLAADRWPIERLRLTAEYQRVSGEQVRTAVASQLGRGFFAVDLAEVQQAVAALPWVERVEVRKRWPDLPILVLTQIRSPAVLRSIIEAGASALVNKSDAPAELTLAINAVLLGCGYVGAAARRRMEASPRTRDALSPRESEVLRLYASGLSVKEISELLARSAKTISNQKMAAMEKLGITSDLEIFGYASEHGMLP